MTKPADPGDPSPVDRLLHRLRLTAFDGLSLSVPGRVHFLSSFTERPVLQPGPCQSDHSLASALDGLPIVSGWQATFDPSFTSPSGAMNSWDSNSDDGNE